MTIKEIENALGMTRANIRYYEQEALLQPKRLKNGYRDYSEQDILCLKKIKLLRKLGVPLADIKALQIGELLLSEEMQHRIKELSQQQKEMEYEKHICENILQEQISYCELDADKYLYCAFENEKTKIEECLIQDQPAKILPFRRFMARAFDLLLLLETSICIVSLFHLDYHLFMPVFSTIFVLQIISILTEPIFLHFIGTTVGKWILGFSITDLDGRRLTYRAAFRRTVKTYFFGIGFGIPVFNLYRLYKSYQTVNAGLKAPWDDEIEYTQCHSMQVGWRLRFQNSYWRYALLLTVFIASYIVTYGCTLYAIIPENHGKLTLEDFVENYNQTANYFGYTEYYLRMKPDGTFYTAQEVYQHKAEELKQTGSYLAAVLQEYEQPEFSYSFDGEYLKQVTMHIELNNCAQTDYFIYPYKPIALAVLAFAGAQNGIGFWKNERGKIVEDLMHADLSKGFSYKMGDMNLLCKVSYDGFSLVDVNGYLMACDEKNWFHLDFTMGNETL